MQAFILKRDEVEGLEVTETTAIDQSLMRIFKDRDQALAAIKLGLLKEGEVFGTIDDDESNATSQDQLRSLQEQIRELQEQTGDISSILPEDVSSENLLETVQGVLTQIQALDVAERGGDGKYIKAISETDGKISATEQALKTAIDTSNIAPTSSAVKTYVDNAVNTLQGNLDIATNDISANHSAIQTEKSRAEGVEGALDTRIGDIEDDHLTSADKTALQTAISNETTARGTAISNAISTEVTNRNTAITNAINGEVTNRNTAITNAIDALDKADTAVTGQYVSAVSETNGKISVTRANLPSVPQMSLSGTTLTITL